MKSFISALALILIASAGATAADTVEGINTVSMTSAKTVAIAPHGSVSVTANDADIKIRTWKHAKVAVRSEAVHQAIVVNALNLQGNVVIDAKGYTTNSPIASAIHVIYVPEGSTINLALTNGELIVDDPEHTLDINAGASSSLGVLDSADSQ